MGLALIDEGAHELFVRRALLDAGERAILLRDDGIDAGTQESSTRSSPRWTPWTHEDTREVGAEQGGPRVAIGCWGMVCLRRSEGDSRRAREYNMEMDVVPSFVPGMEV